jgi:hypothetical protein
MFRSALITQESPARLIVDLWRPSRTDLGLGLTCFRECLNMVSFFLGRLLVAFHRATLFWRLEKAVILPRLALSPPDRAALAVGVVCGQSKADLSKRVSVRPDPGRGPAVKRLKHERLR